MRPACLPQRSTILKERDSSLYRLTRSSSFDVSKASTYEPKNYTVLENEKCNEYNRDVFGDTVFCAKTNSSSGMVGDPFHVRVMENGTYPIYLVGFDAYGNNANPSLFVDTYSNIEWIKDTIQQKVDKTENRVIWPHIRASEKN